MFLELIDRVSKQMQMIGRIRIITSSKVHTFDINRIQLFYSYALYLIRGHKARKAKQGAQSFLPYHSSASLSSDLWSGPFLPLNSFQYLFWTIFIKLWKKTFTNYKSQCYQQSSRKILNKENSRPTLPIIVILLPNIIEY